MNVEKAARRDRIRARAQRGMKVDDSARKIALRKRDAEWRRARGARAEVAQ